jgi:glycosyltransferase involved in cell wall biosynthesis
LSHIHKALAFEWTAVGMDPQQFDLHFILLNPGPTALEDFLLSHGIRVHRVKYRSKKDFVSALRQVRRILKLEKPQVVHAHLFDASLAGLLAARLTGVQKRIYTRHYATYHHQYFPRAVWYDRIINWLATDIVAISRNVQDTLWELERVPTVKTHLIHHGFHLNLFDNPQAVRVNVLRDKYLPKTKYPVIGVIARYFELKGIQYIIPAFKRLLQNGYPQAKLVLANASGDYAPVIRRALAELPEESYVEIPFEEDVPALYKLFDVYVHVPINPQIEAFGQTYIEALAARVPSVFTLSGVATEFIAHEKNALVVPFQDAEAIYQAIMRLLEDGLLRDRLREQGVSDVNRFAISNMIDQLQHLYLSGTKAKHQVG